MVVPRWTVRVFLAALILLSATTLAVGYVEAERSSQQVTGDPSVEQAFRTGNRSPVVDERDGITVIATDSNAYIGDESDGARALAELVAFAPDGRIFYYQNDHTRYWDVDPVEGTTSTVEFVYADHLDASQCGGETDCTRNGIERVDLMTGERTQIYSRITPGKHSTRWHDVDRIDDEHLLVADIYQDRVFVVNTTNEIIEWEWDAQTDYDVDETGGPFPSDWTHLNDVEYVEIDGRPVVMVSLRNQDQVVFIDMEEGLMEEWTLGSEDDYDTIYEQHNPDFIPEERGGPAVLVADSENGRVIEYQREDGSWVQSWTWTDERMRWPRDADRLPNGNTLITDSNGDRVLEVDPNGTVVWSATIGFPYEAERLGTGDESAGGQSAVALGLPSQTLDDLDTSVQTQVTETLPPDIVNAISYVFPRWVGTIEVLAVLILIGTVVTWMALEYRWAGYSIGLRIPISLRRRQS
ncbi:arylsulfotransferase family protein [Haloferax namakaokahaiae]|uniref:Arylsulfotransferase family protein n=1 Tax=Haloferax namakaokahaiae TaxID=1748331 RepID=A0ABD5ZB46_9EURY